VAPEEDKQPADGSQRPPRILLRTFGLMKGNLHYVGFALLFTISCAFLEAFIPSVMRRAINYLESLASWIATSERAGRPAFDSLASGDDYLALLTPLILFVVIIVIVAALTGLVTLVKAVLNAVMLQKNLEKIRVRLFGATQELPYGTHEKITTGQLISRATNDITTLRQFFRVMLVQIVEMGFHACFAIYFMATTNVTLTLLVFAPIVPAWIFIASFSRKIGPKSKKVMEGYGELSTEVQENIAGVRVVRSFAQEDAEIERFSRKNDTYVALMMERVKYVAMRFPVAGFMMNLGIPLVLLYGGRMYLDGVITLGDVCLFILYVQALSGRLRVVSQIAQVTPEALAGARRLFEIFDSVPKPCQLGKRLPLPEGAGRVTFEQVSFRYPGTDANVLEDISFTVEPGEKVAILGRAGEGKTSLVNLLAKFYEPTAGRIILDGADLRDLDPKALRKAIGFVLQEPFLFAMSLRDNITYGDPCVSDGAIEEVARAAQIADFIDSLDGAYDTVIGERGVTLSGGQRQRVSIARAILKQPRILIMDDATSSVDSETEQQIHEAIREVTRNRTTFIIAHRLSTIMDCDKIVVIEDGRITQTGTHRELVEREGFYREIHDAQIGEDE